ncbi:hypothetical protein F4859DRAFT_466697 [Xylaria cf. heliscus]|nr:hypothetical protein F4859DRAFT_466697 [Xylaria cf. heliscus]
MAKLPYRTLLTPLTLLYSTAQHTYLRFQQQMHAVQRRDMGQMLGASGIHANYRTLPAELPPSAYYLSVRHCTLRRCSVVVPCKRSRGIPRYLRKYSIAGAWVWWLLASEVLLLIVLIGRFNMARDDHSAGS